jgi:poly-gamma-glutamate biosynthesis protein PgsC/CapC
MNLAESLAVGLVIGFVFWETIGLSAGGLVVPGYIALQLDRPADLVVTLGTSLLTWVSVKALSRYAIVFGRRRFILAVLVGFSWLWLLRSFAPVFAGVVGAAGAAVGAVPGPGGEAFGLVVPGLIANEMDRQRVLPTALALVVVSVMVRCTLIVLGWLA